MPKNKDLKRLIRARMEKTGESYTTARSHIVSSDPPPLPDDYEALAGTSDEAVRKASGMTWPEWVDVLDRIGAATMEHRAIAAHVAETRPVSRWWSQMITVAYERLRGLRDVGQRRDGDYEVNKSRTVPASVDRLWEAVHDPDRRIRWLPATPLTVSTATRPRSIRGILEDGTRLDAHFTPRGPGRSTLSLQHRGLPDREAAERSRAFWSERVEVLAALLEGSVP